MKRNCKNCGGLVSITEETALDGSGKKYKRVLDVKLSEISGINVSHGCKLEEVLGD